MVQNGKPTAQCAKKNFDIGTMGESALKSHGKSQKHKKTFGAQTDNRKATYTY